MASLIMSLLMGGCHWLGSRTEAIVDEGNQHAFGFLPVHNYLPNPSQGAALTEGQQYASDLMSEMLFYAMVECLPTKGVNAAEWYAALEGRALMDQLFINANRDLVFPNDQPGKPSAPTPCRVVNKKLLTYPVIKEALNTPYAAKSVTIGMYRVAQAFYLSLRGAYKPGADGNKSARLGLIPLAKMLKAQAGVTSIDADAFISDVIAMDADFNPCERDASKAKLKGEAQRWKTENYTCVSASNGSYNYLPGGGLAYEAVRDAVGHEIDVLHDKVHGAGTTALAANPTTNRNNLFTIVTSTDKPLSVAQIQAMYAADYGASYLLGDEVETDAGAMLALKNKGGPKRPAAPASTSLNQALAGFGSKVTAGKGAGGAAAGKKGTPPANGKPASAADGLAKLKHNLAQEAALKKAGASSADKARAVGIADNTYYLDRTDSDLLAKVAAGKTDGMKPIALSADSPFVAYRDTASGEQVSVNKTTGDAFVYKDAKVDGIQGNVTEISNWPHAGTKETNGAMGDDYVGSYLRTDGSKTQMGLHVGDNKGEKNFELDTVKDKDGNLQVACSDKNQKTLDSIREESSAAKSAGETAKAAAMNDYVDTALKYKACANGGLKLSGFGLDGGDEGCPGGGAEPEATVENQPTGPGAGSDAEPGSVAPTEASKPDASPGASQEEVASAGGAGEGEPSVASEPSWKDASVENVMEQNANEKENYLEDTQAQQVAQEDVYAPANEWTSDYASGGSYGEGEGTPAEGGYEPSAGEGAPVEGGYEAGGGEEYI